MLNFSDPMFFKFAAALGLAGMILSTGVMMTGLMTLGLGCLLLSIVLFMWGERAFYKPIYWLIPFGWLLFSFLVGPGKQGENLFLGSVPLIMLLLWIRRRSNQAA